MLSYLIRRVLLALFTCWAISVLAFVIIQLPPGDFVDAYIANLSASGSGISADQAEQLRAEYALDQPMYVQYARWMRLMARRPGHGHGVAAAGDGGHRRPALADDGRLDRRGAADLDRRPADRHPPVRPYSPLDYLFTLLGFLGLAIPSFLLGLLVLYFGSSTSTPTSAGCSRLSMSTPLEWDKLVDMSSTCRCRQ